MVKNNTLRVGTYKSFTNKYLVESIDIVDTLVKFIDTEAKIKY